jgi:ABC-type microcin C transport system duplicated ATPase subunit YejF
MMNSGPPAYNSNGMSRSGYEVSGQDISLLSEPVNSLDPLNAMEKSLHDQVKFLTERKRAAIKIY